MAEPDFSDVVERLKKIIGTVHESDVADYLGLHKESIYSFRRRNSIPYKAIVAKFSDTQYDLDWILLGRGSATTPRIPLDEAPTEPPGVFVDFFPGVQASAGFGCDNHHEERERIYLPGSILKRKPKDIHAVRVEGDSMEPTVKDGDIILISRAETDCEPLSGKLYVLKLENEIFVKRLTRAPGQWLITSDNPLYQPITAPKDAFEVLGRVILKMEDL